MCDRQPLAEWTRSLPLRSLIREKALKSVTGRASVAEVKLPRNSSAAAAQRQVLAEMWRSDVMGLCAVPSSAPPKMWSVVP